MFRHHADETRQQVENLREALRLLDLPESTAPSPSTKGISRQAGSLIAKSAPALRDRVTLSCALGNEHYEMSAYQSLLVPVHAMGADDVARLLQENLDQEAHTSEELHAKLEEIAAG